MTPEIQLECDGLKRSLYAQTRFTARKSVEDILFSAPGTIGHDFHISKEELKQLGYVPENPVKEVPVFNLDFTVKYMIERLMEALNVETAAGHYNNVKDITDALMNLTYITEEE